MSCSQARFPAGFPPRLLAEVHLSCIYILLIHFESSTVCPCQHVDLTGTNGHTGTVCPAVFLNPIVVPGCFQQTLQLTVAQVVLPNE